MKRYFALGALVLALVGVGATMMPQREPSAFALGAFGRLPVQADGRIKPMDTIARTSLLMLQGRQAVTTADGRTLPPVAWLLDVFFQPTVADSYRIFRIDNPDLLSIFGLSADGVRFSFDQLQSGFPELERQARLAEPVEAPTRTAFQRAVMDLFGHVEYYERLKYSLQPLEKVDLSAELDDHGLRQLDLSELQSLEPSNPLGIVPPFAAGARPGEWQCVAHSLLASMPTGAVDPSVRTYAKLGAAWRETRPEVFNEVVGAYQAQISSAFPSVARRCAFEAVFNHVQPFYTSMVLYIAAFLVAVISWLKWPAELESAAFRMMVLAFVLATAGILARMWLEGRPPVTNLYSSALFIGWGSAALCLALERINLNGVACAAGSLIGFATLVIAHNLSLSGDTLEMMRAVLDSNFWLSTHVVTVTTGYASTFLAGFLAIIYILRGALTRTLDAPTADSLARMVYGIVCFATLFSLVGTVLGGIWADQSWGRFWGWDPKENGALIIVLWNAVILHCRWGGLVRQRGLMCLAVFGNIVTAWSWFGTNMLGIGLHSYGFTNAAFQGLLIFVALQLAVICIAAIPRDKWRSRLVVRMP